jgi:transcriptional regulator with XRE-family HTH domain
MSTMGERIRVLRESKGLTQEQLAAQLGVTKGAVHQWEKDITKNVKNVTFLALSQVLGTTQEYLLFGPPSERETPRSTSRKPR